MNSTPHNSRPRRSAILLIAGILCCLTPARVQAATTLSQFLQDLFDAVANAIAAATATTPDILRLDITTDRTTASVSAGEIIRFRIRYNCASTSDSALNAVITDVLDPSLQIVSVQGSAHTTSAAFNASTATATFTFITPLPAGTTGELFIQAKFKSGTPTNTVATNGAAFSADNSVSQASNVVSVTATNGGGGPSYTPGLSVTKYGTGSTTPTGPSLFYSVRHGNTGDTADALASYAVEDPLPAGTSLIYFGTDTWSGPAVPVTVRYKTNLNSSWRQWGSGPLYDTATRTWFYATNLSLPATEWVIALRHEYGTLPGGGTFLPGNMNSLLEYQVSMRNPASFTPGVDIVNCATASATGYSQTSCVNTTVLPATPSPYLDLENNMVAHSEPYAPGEVFQAELHVGVGPDSSTGMDDPVAYLLLPPAMEYTGNWRMRWWATGSPLINPVYTRTDNFGSPGWTLITFSWQSGNPMFLPNDGTWNELMVEADVRVKAGTADGDYTIDAFGQWRTPASEGTQWFEPDTLDVDRDGNTTERVARDDATITVKSPTPEPYFAISSDGVHGEPWGVGEAFEAEVRIGVRSNSISGMDDPVLYLLLPPAFEFLNTWRVGYYASGSPAVPPDFTKIDDFKAPGQTLLMWSWQNGNPVNIPADGSTNYTKIIADIRVRPGTVNADYPLRGWGKWRTPANATGSQYYQSDTLDVDADSDTAELLASDATDVTVLTGNGVAGLESTMFVRGELDSAWNKFPAVGQTVQGGRADYELHLKNPGGIAMKDAIVLDILPTIGDTGVIDLSARGSLWEPFLVAAISPPAGVTVLYSTSNNPCRPELVPSGPPGCQAPAWSSTPPADITTVRSLKFDLTGKQMLPGEEVIIAWSMRAPWGAPYSGEVAWNSFGFTATRADNNDTMLATEPVKTGISVDKPLPPYYGDRVWMDTNRNGIQDAGESGINGVPVILFRDNGDNIPNPSTDTLVAFTATTTDAGQAGKYLFGNIGPGSYFAVVIAPSGHGLTTKDAAAAVDDTDSDGSSIVYRNRRAAIMPVTSLTALEEDRSWDQGFYPRTNIPAVWAVVEDASGKNILGGVFTKSHGTARNNIARVNADGSLDTTFNPGTGFDGAVRSLAVRGDGLIWAGGNFFNYSGNPSKGVALLQPNGTWDSRPARPDTNEVNWVGTSGNLLYLGGGFGKVGGIPCGNIARLNADGTVDTTFNKGNGANGPVYGGAILADGSLLVVGGFTAYHSSPASGVAKIKPDGSVDGSFNTGTGAGGGEVYSVKALEDGRMILTGNFRNFNGTACNGTIRLKEHGQIDNAMTDSTLDVQSINTSN